MAAAGAGPGARDFIKIGVLRHSFVIGLLKREAIFGRVNSNFNSDNVSVKFFGKGSMTLDKMVRKKDGVVDYSPHIIVLLLGENDIVQNSQPEALAKEIKDAAWKLCECDGVCT